MCNICVKYSKKYFRLKDLEGVRLEYLFSEYVCDVDKVIKPRLRRLSKQRYVSNKPREIRVVDGKSSIVHGSEVVITIDRPFGFLRIDLDNESYVVIRDALYPILHHAYKVCK